MQFHWTFLKIRFMQNLKPLLDSEIPDISIQTFLWAWKSFHALIINQVSQSRQCRVGVASLQLLIASRTTLENCLVPFLSLPPPILLTRCSKLVYFDSKEKKISYFFVLDLPFRYTDMSSSCIPQSHEQQTMLQLQNYFFFQKMAVNR